MRNSCRTLGLIIAAMLMLLRTAEAQGLSDAVDATQLVWTTGGVSNWVPVSDHSHDGVDSALGYIYMGSGFPCWIETVATGPAAVAFWWDFQALAVGYGYAQFGVDGLSAAIRTSLNGGGWQNWTTVFGTGTHTLRWEVASIEPQVGGYVAAWLDEVVLSPLSPDIQISVPSSDTIVLRWNSITTLTYAVQSSTNLLTGFSVLQSNVVATPPVNSYTDSVVTDPQKFWRIETDL